MTRSIDSGLRLLRDAGLLRGAKGMSAAEIAQIEAMAGGHLPATYIQFLSRLGVSAGLFMHGSDFTCGQLPGINRIAREITSKVNVVLPRTAFVFLMHQGYDFLYLDPAEGNDPEVWKFEDGGTVRRLGMSFSAWFDLAASDEAQGRE